MKMRQRKTRVMKGRVKDRLDRLIDWIVRLTTEYFRAMRRGHLRYADRLVGAMHTRKPRAKYR